ncbi:hypothetical protein [Streptomyces sp. NPDC005336]|uniref:hypothetical protein n=1 Tax=Streptomyces sp. NPDC005336 TaxID=3157035 RepID=UPI0033ABE521
MAERYEQLRSAIIEGRGGGWRHGFSVLVRSGMAAWSLALAALHGREEPRSEPAPVSEASVGDHLGAELVDVLASLVLGRLQPP